MNIYIAHVDIMLKIFMHFFGQHSQPLKTNKSVETHVCANIHRQSQANLAASLFHTSRYMRRRTRVYVHVCVCDLDRRRVRKK